MKWLQTRMLLELKRNERRMRIIGDLHFN
jgi:hypothetical protein